MAEHVLIPVDGSPQATKALEHAFTEQADAAFTLLHVIDPIEASYSAEAVLPDYSEQWYESQKQAAEDLFEEARTVARDHGKSFSTAIEVGSPARTIVEYAENHDTDHIVMGSHGRSGVTRILLGSVAETVVRRSPVPVTVVR